MVHTTLDEQRAYDEATFNAEAIACPERSKTLCGYFNAGQSIPVHAPDSDITIVVQSGRGIVRKGETTHEVSMGSIVTVSAGTDRGIKADEERLEAVLVVSPPPTDAEHEPVKRGLAAGTFDPA